MLSGQSQKEFYVNEALLRADIAVQCVVVAETNAPPPSPLEGQAWLVGANPTSNFSGRARAIAGFSASGWRYVQPSEGFRIFDLQKGAFRVFRGGEWRSASVPDAPNGGASVDSEARAVLAQLLQRLTDVGIFTAA